MIQNEPQKLFGAVPTFYGVYEDFKEEVMTYGGRDWNEGTIADYDRDVLRHIIPYLKDHDQKTIGDYTIQDYLDVFDQIKKKSKGPEGAHYQESGVPKKVDFLIRAVVWTASNHGLCENLFDKNRGGREGGGGIGRRTGLEQARTKKSLTIRQEKAVAQYLLKNIHKSSSAVGLMLMYALGLRNNEACGANFGYIREFAEYPGHYYLIVPQSTNLGANTLKILGKTANSGRKVPIPKLLEEILLDIQLVRYKKALSDGYQGSAGDLPIACINNNPLKRCSADDLSRAAKDMFIAIGMREDDIIRVKYELLEEAQVAKDEMEEDEFKEIESDPTAYLLRRNFATHLAILGLRDVEIWYVIGHKIEDEFVKRRAFNDERLLFALKKKMDERPILNPVLLEEVYRVGSDKVTSISGSKRMILEIPKEQLTGAQIHVTAEEPGDEIEVRVTTNSQTEEIQSTFASYSVPLMDAPKRTIDGTRFYLGQFLEEEGR